MARASDLRWLQEGLLALFHSAFILIACIPVLLTASRHFGFPIGAHGRAAIPNSTVLTASRIAHSMLTHVIAEPRTTLDCIASLSPRHCNPCYPSNSVDKLQHCAAHTHRSETAAGTRLHSIPLLVVSRQTGYTRWRANPAPSSSLLQEAPLPWLGSGCPLLLAVDPPHSRGPHSPMKFGWLRHFPLTAATLPFSSTFYASSCSIL